MRGIPLIVFLFLFAGLSLRPEVVYAGLAVHGNNLENLQALKNSDSLAIEVFSASGGGTLNGNGVNKYKTNGDCGQRPLSDCNDSQMKGQLEDIVKNLVLPILGRGDDSSVFKQISTVMSQAITAIGTFFDAEMQLSTQREMQTLVAKAYKDYHPSQQMCYFGSFIRSVPKAEEIYGFNKLKLNDLLMSTYLAKAYNASSSGNAGYVNAQIGLIQKEYCNPQDNNGTLVDFCKESKDPLRMDKDIDVARTLMMPKALDIDYSDMNTSSDEQDILALARHLYWNQSIMMSKNSDDIKEGKTKYFNWRNLAAVNNVAHNSFTEIVSMKSPTINSQSIVPGWKYMKAYMKNKGEWKISEDGTSIDGKTWTEENIIDKEMGNLASYYAQMEFLTKSMYQAPDFYTNLYDKPANVRRMSVSMEAIKNMQARDQYESALRKEMLLSLMLEEKIRKELERVNSRLGSQ